MSDTCPYCPPASAWGMAAGSYEAFKAWHDAGHPRTAFTDFEKGLIAPDLSSENDASKVASPNPHPQSIEGNT